MSFILHRNQSAAPRREAIPGRVQYYYSVDVPVEQAFLLSTAPIPVDDLKILTLAVGVETAGRHYGGCIGIETDYIGNPAVNPARVRFISFYGVTGEPFFYDGIAVWPKSLRLRLYNAGAQTKFNVLVTLRSF